MKKVISFLFSFVSTSILFVLFGGAMAYATFIENDYDTITSKALVYNSWWFNLLLLVMIIHLIGSLFYNKVFKLKKFSILLFHLAFISMFLGSAITRFYSFEGLMHIRENETSNFIKSSDYYLNIEYINADGQKEVYSKKHILSPYVYTNFKDSYEIANKDVKITGLNYFSKAVEAAMFDENGVPAITFFLSDSLGNNQRIILQKGDYYKSKLISFGFDSEIETDVQFSNKGEQVFIASSDSIQYYNMFKPKREIKFTSDVDSASVNYMYHLNSSNFNIKSFKEKSRVQTFSMKGQNQNQHNSVLNALILNLDVDGVEKEISLLVDSRNGKPVEKFVSLNGLEMYLQYGKKQIMVPFEVRLNDFILDKYIGSMNPSSFKSKVTVIDPAEDTTFDYEIFMNNILDYKGYRLFQSSYDNDEKGTVLSVNYDFWGTMVTYLGYLLMTIGITLSLFNPKSRLVSLLKKTAKKSNVAALIIISSTLFTTLQAQNNDAGANSSIVFQDIDNHGHTHNFVLNKVDQKVAKEFGEVLVVDLKGRLKPLNTLSSEIIRKVARQSTFEGLNSTEVLVEMALRPENWKNAKIIKISSDKLKKLLNTTEERVSFNTLVETSVNQKNALSFYANIASKKLASDRDSFDKDVIKVSERADILYLVFSGNIFKLFPQEDCADCEWQNITELKSGTTAYEIIHEFATAYDANNSEKSISALKRLKDYQQKNSTIELPSEAKISAERLYNSVNFFPKLAIAYFISGLILLIISFLKLLNTNIKLSLVEKIFKYLILTTAALHLFAFALRWYIAGYAPMSNGYETILFIALITIGSGIFFSSRSQITYAVSSILASILLLVASLSYFDPEITNQAPVLKSVWLVIHVAIITMSYGFFGIAALLGLFNLLLYLFINNKNKSKIISSIDELVDIIEITLIIGLYLLTIGTFLGAVWANESWGRYWGWDPKETWALITILVYAVYVHMRRTKYFRSSFAASFWALICLSSVLMTYFGVNYFLSGLHSYAGDGPSNIPTWVYYAVLAIAVISVGSYGKYRKIK